MALNAMHNLAGKTSLISPDSIKIAYRDTECKSALQKLWVKFASTHT